MSLIYIPANALSALFDEKIVHRDIKPTNILYFSHKGMKGYSLTHPKWNFDMKLTWKWKWKKNKNKLQESGTYGVPDEKTKSVRDEGKSRQSNRSCAARAVWVFHPSIVDRQHIFNSILYPPRIFKGNRGVSWIFVKFGGGPSSWYHMYI